MFVTGTARNIDRGEASEMVTEIDVPPLQLLCAALPFIMLLSMIADYLVYMPSL